MSTVSTVMMTQEVFDLLKAIETAEKPEKFCGDCGWEYSESLSDDMCAQCIEDMDREGEE